MKNINGPSYTTMILSFHHIFLDGTKVPEFSYASMKR